MRIKTEFVRFGRVGGMHCKFTHFDRHTNSWWTYDLKVKDDDGRDVYGTWVKAEKIQWNGGVR